MIYLVDANVLSEPTKPAPSGQVIAWLREHERDLVIDSVVFGELYIGLIALPLGRKRAGLEAWFAAVVERIQCLPWDAAVARRWAELIVGLKKSGQAVPVLDGMIAATALHHGLTVATRNGRDFEKAGVSIVDPFT